MTTSAISTAPARITVAGMAGDLYGGPDGRSPLVLLGGLTYGRAIWRPVLSHLGRIDPGRQVLVLDLPGHGDSPGQLPHTVEHSALLVRDAVAEAGLGTPVLVGHSMSGGIASMYAAQYPASGVINVDAPPDLATFVLMLRAVIDEHDGDLLATWATIERGFRTDLLSPEMRQFVARHSRPSAELLASYWAETMAMSADQAAAMVGAAVDAVTAAKIPYLLVLGSEMSPDTAAWMRDKASHATVELWAGSGHFPHLKHPARFAGRLAATA
jgi:pimeloyl-ACP methyl ester carboxylesterase